MIRRGVHRGTRFLLYPQYDEGMRAELVTVSSPVGSLLPGPRDHAMYVADAIRKLEPYDPPNTAPPCPAPHHAPARPNAAGHFDHLRPHMPQFLAAHLFGTVRRTLDVWEHYLGHRVEWWHAEDFPLLELVPLVAWQNAQCGPGFLETGVWPAGDGEWQPFALNHDIVAHEVGHAVLFSLMGVPPAERLGREFLAFHECFSDLSALLGALHFRSVRRRLMAQTRGNLYVLNLVSRLGETSRHAQIRIADNTRVMADVADVTLNPDLSWNDPTGRHRNAHAVAEPLTGALFDVLVDLYQDGLVRRGLIAPDDDPRGWSRAEVEASMGRLQTATAAAFARLSGGFHAALDAARDHVARALCHVATTLSPDALTFDRVAARFLESIALQGFGSMLGALVGNFHEREIDPGPYMLARPVRFRADLVRIEAAPPLACRCGGTHEIARTRRLMTHPHRAA